MNLNQPSNEGLLARLRANETLQRLTGGRPDLAIFGVPVLAVVLIIGVVAAGFALAGNGDDREVTVAETNTPRATWTAGVSAGEKTPFPISPGDELTLADLAVRGAGEPVRGPFLGERLLIPSIGVDAPFSVRNVGRDGQMPDPDGAWDVAWYDFSDWPLLGGTPGLGGNVVVAGHVDYTGVGPAVFWDLEDLQAGDIVQIRMQDGSLVTYEVVFNKWVSVDSDVFRDWSSIVAGTSPESITLITCGGEFSEGNYDHRQIAWAQRVEDV
jgi:LPXTG-site transpeptidase (sortase) family protein